MTYNVFSGTLNPTQSINQPLPPNSIIKTAVDNARIGPRSNAVSSSRFAAAATLTPCCINEINEATLFNASATATRDRNECLTPVLANVYSRSRSLTFAICCLPSVCLSICRSCTLLSRLKFSAMFLRHLVRWISFDIHGKFYGYRRRGTPPSAGGGVKRKRGSQKII